MAEDSIEEFAAAIAGDVDVLEHLLFPHTLLDVFLRHGVNKLLMETSRIYNEFTRIINGFLYFLLRALLSISLLSAAVSSLLFTGGSRLTPQHYGGSSMAGTTSRSVSLTCIASDRGRFLLTVSRARSTALVAFVGAPLAACETTPTAFNCISSAG